jgi:tetratricopeptide (TPR) repeat protein
MRYACTMIVSLVFAAVGVAQESSGDLLAPMLAKREATAASDAKNWADAEAKWEKATILNPTDANAWLELGRARYYEKKYAEAIEPLEKADALGVSYPWDMPYFEACCYALAGKPDQAMAKLEDAIDKGFRDLRAISTDDDLKSLRDLPKFEVLTDSDDVTKLDRTAGIVHDIRFYERELKRLDYRELNSKGTGLDAFADQFASDAPSLTDNQVMVRFMQMGALMRDGHTGIYPPHPGKDGLPVIFAKFQEGTFITATEPEQKDLLGWKLDSIDGNSVDKLYAGVGTVLGRENDQWLLSRGPRFFSKPRCLNGLGLAKSDKQVTLQLEKDGATKSVTLTSGYEDVSKDWMTLSKSFVGARPLIYQNREKQFWYKYLPESKTLYFVYNGVSNEKDKTVSDFAKEMFAFVDSHEVEKMIVDTRFNGGGNNFLNMPLVLGLAQSKMNKPGHLFVIVGRDTFSAAMCFVTQVERYTSAIFAGEPTGSAPNFIGESIPVNLRYVNMQGTISDLYWQNSVAMDHRIWISPEIYVPPTFAAYAGNRDPVFEAVMAYKS